MRCTVGRAARFARATVVACPTKALRSRWNIPSWHDWADRIAIRVYTPCIRPYVSRIVWQIRTTIFWIRVSERIVFDPYFRCPPYFNRISLRRRTPNSPSTLTTRRRRGTTTLCHSFYTSTRTGMHNPNPKRKMSPRKLHRSAGG
jgi:hypothetical protein